MYMSSRRSLALCIFVGAYKVMKDLNFVWLVLFPLQLGGSIPKISASVKITTMNLTKELQILRQNVSNSMFNALGGNDCNGILLLIALTIQVLVIQRRQWF